MSTTEIIIGIVAGLVVNEFYDISPWAARKIVIWSARARYGRSPRAEVRAEEFAAVIDSRPGKLLKLVTALAFACGATAVRAHQIVLLLRLNIELTNRTADIALKRAPVEANDSQPPLETHIKQQLVITGNMMSHGTDLEHLKAIWTGLKPAENLVQLSGRANRRFSD